VIFNTRKTALLLCNVAKDADVNKVQRSLAPKKSLHALSATQS